MCRAHMNMERALSEPRYLLTLDPNGIQREPKGSQRGAKVEGYNIFVKKSVKRQDYVQLGRGHLSISPFSYLWFGNLSVIIAEQF